MSKCHIVSQKAAEAEFVRSPWRPDFKEAFEMSSYSIVRPRTWPLWLLDARAKDYVHLGTGFLRICTPIGDMFCEVGNWIVLQLGTGHVYPSNKASLRATVRELRVMDLSLNECEKWRFADLALEGEVAFQSRNRRPVKRKRAFVL